MSEKKNSTYQIYCDGGSRGNPGRAAGAAVILKNGKKVDSVSRFLGTATNNQAEYRAVILALDWLEKAAARGARADFYLDSKLIVEQLAGNYKLKNEGLKPLFWQIREKIMTLGISANFQHIPREKNAEADELVNETLDQSQISKCKSQNDNSKFKIKRQLQRRIL